MWRTFAEIFRSERCKGISFPRHWPAPSLSQVGYCDLDLIISEISPFSEMSEISQTLVCSHWCLRVCCRFVGQLSPVIHFIVLLTGLFISVSAVAVLLERMTVRLLWKSVCGTRKCYSAPVVDYRRCLSPCRRRVPCIPVRVILIFSSYCIPVSFALFDHFLLGSGRLGLFAFSFRLVSAWFFPVVFLLDGFQRCKGMQIL